MKNPRVMVEGYVWSDLLGDWFRVALLGEIQYDLPTGATLILLSTGHFIGLLNCVVLD